MARFSRNRKGAEKAIEAKFGFFQCHKNCVTSSYPNPRHRFVTMTCVINAIYTINVIYIISVTFVMFIINAINDSK